MTHRITLVLTALLLSACQQTPPPPAFDYPHRVIAIDGPALAAGDLRYNIVLWDGDVIWAGARPAPSEPPFAAIEQDRVRPESAGTRHVEEFPLRPEDTVLVTIYELRTPGIDDQQQRRIDEHGGLRLYMVGHLQAAGKTPSQLEREIANKLETDGRLRDATVAVQLLSSPHRKVHLRGIQRTYVGAGDPNTIPLTRQEFRLLEAIEQFGGLPESGWQNLAVVRRTAN